MKASSSHRRDHWTRSLLGLVLAFALTSTNVHTTLAGPPTVPSHFWGEVHVTDGVPAVAVGTVIDAYVPGYALPAGTTTVISYNGGLVYAIDVNADSTDTPAKDGGVAGDTVTFQIGTRVVSKGPWDPDLNQNLNIHPPDAALAANTVSEGTPVTLNASGSTDWGSDIATYAFDCNNDQNYEIAPQAASSATCTYPDSGSYTAGVRVVDAKGGVSTATVVVTVNNAAPVVNLTGAGTTAEGAVYNLTVSAVDVDPIKAWNISWGDGQSSLNQPGGTTAYSHTYADGPNSYTISVTATDDEDSVSAPKTLPVSVTNVIPTFTISGAANVNEGASYTLTLTRTGEPGADAVQTWSVNWGDGQSTTNLAGNVTQATHTFADGPASRNIAASVTDDDGTYNSNTLAVTVANVLPTVSLGGPYTTAEGTAVTITATATDVAADPLTYAWNLGSGFGAPGAANTTSFTPQDDGAPTVAVRVCDDTTPTPGCSEASVAVTATNVSPTGVTAGGPYTNKPSGSPVTLTGTATCPLVDTCTYNWDLDADGQYDDGSGLTVSYTWYAVGSHPVRMQVNDGDAPVTSAVVNVQIVNATHSITLYPGWNLVSFNLQPASTAPADLFAGLGTDFDLVYAWDNTKANGGWLTYTTAAPFGNTLTAINANMGFWIHITSATNKTLTVTGPAQATSNIALTTTAGGWNLVGYPAATTNALPAALTNHGGTNATLVYSYVANDTDHWKIFDIPTVALFANDLTQLAPGRGYWVFVTANNTWHVEYP